MMMYRFITEHKIDITLVTEVISDKYYANNEFFITTTQKLFDPPASNLDMAHVSGPDAEWMFITFENDKYSFFIVPTDDETITILKLMIK